MPSAYKGTPEEVLALSTFIKLTRSVNALLGQTNPMLQREFGLTESQLAVLEAVYHLGPLCQGELGQKILRSGSNVTTVVDNLERNGLVRRQRDAHDRRMQIVHLTNQGRTVIAAALPGHVGRITSLISVLSCEEQQELGRICKKLGTARAR